MKLVAGIKELTGKLLFRGFWKATRVEKGLKLRFTLMNTRGLTKATIYFLKERKKPLWHFQDHNF
jgi:hypothetical protein